ncbi:probable choline kinase 2 isoform X2 [Abrus precatorius]|uniref:Probable choline kinase 2 isoform X2 n=1 Tax=Abrus precatorius TaxID=3816 RepID=A0A8B8KFR7_ABRPR|nr:probable choline kinase 2 isoform X2 [Abrus precatorius]
MGATENLVDNATGAAESPENHTTGPLENPIYDNAGSSESENPVQDQALGAENVVSDQVGGVQNPTRKQEGSAENLVNNQAGAAEISVNDEVGASENAVNDKAGGVENSLSKQIDATESLVTDKQGPAESLVEDEAHAVEMSVNSKANAVETPVSSKANRLPEEAKEILKSLASKWEDVLDPNALQVIPVKGAMTNEVFQIKWPTTTGETSRKVLVRIYGEGVDIFFDRGHEIQTFEFMSKNGQGPRLLGRFAIGRVEEFIHARTLSASDLRDPSISSLIAAKMKEFHDLDMPGEKKVHLWDTLRNWLSEAKRLSSPQEVEAFYLDTIDKEISLLEKELLGTHQWIGFCHNDLQYGNIMLDEETNSLTIIDYEYANYNPVAYDIANHFCEMAANYHTEEPHILDYSKYPDFEERQRFVKAYMSTSGEQPSDNEVEQLLQEIEKHK